MSLPGFTFRDLAKGVHFATASDRYAGWVGQIYSPEKKYKITKTIKTIRGRKFAEEKVPVRAAEEYFQHYSALELDFTFYTYLLRSDGTPARGLPVLQEYARWIPRDGLVLLKVPEAICAPRRRRIVDGRWTFGTNPDYLNPERFTNLFYHPALEVLAERIAGFIFEKPYQRKAECPSAPQNIADLAAFFAAIPHDKRYHIEERTDRLKTGDYFAFLREAGIGNVFSHWTWLPDLQAQWRQAGGFTGELSITRLLTPLRMKYEETYERYFPFDGLRDEFPRLYRDAAMIIREGQNADRPTVTVANNRAGGNANEINRRITAELGFAPLSAGA